MRTISKREAAIAQLDSAIKLFFENRDFVSTYTLAAAADEILEGVWKNEQSTIHQRRISAGQPIAFSFGEEWDMAIKGEYKKQGWQLLKATQNFFKHADKDHDKEHLFHDVESTGLKILTAIRNYNLIFETSTPAMRAFTSWYLLIHPELLKTDAPLKADPAFESFSRQAKQLKALDQFGVGLSILKKACPELYIEHLSTDARTAEK